MAITYPASGKGDINWRDNTDNWTHADTQWLQERMIVRIDSSYATGAYGDNSVLNISAGRVFYNTATGKLNVSNGTSLSALVSSSTISIVDAGDASTGEIKGSSASANTGITINKTTSAITVGAAATFSSTVAVTNAVTLSSTLAVGGATTLSGYLTFLKAGGGYLKTTADGFVINTINGSNSAYDTTIISGALGIEFDRKVIVDGPISASNADISGTLNVSSSSTFTGGSTFNSTVTLGATNPTITSSNGTNPLAISSASDLTLASASAKSIRTTSPIYYGDLAAGKSTNLKNAWVIYTTGASDDPASRAISSKARNSSNVATITTSAAHNLWVGASVTVAVTGDATFNGSVTVTGVPTITTFTYANTGSTVSSVAAAGTVAIPIPDGTLWLY